MTSDPLKTRLTELAEGYLDASLKYKQALFELLRDRTVEQFPEAVAIRLQADYDHGVRSMYCEGVLVTDASLYLMEDEQIPLGDTWVSGENSDAAEKLFVDDEVFSDVVCELEDLEGRDRIELTWPDGEVVVRQLEWDVV